MAKKNKKLSDEFMDELLEDLDQESSTNINSKDQNVSLVDEISLQDSSSNLTIGSKTEPVIDDGKTEIIIDDQSTHGSEKYISLEGTAQTAEGRTLVNMKKVPGVLPFSELNSSEANLSSVLLHSENLRIAQSKIIELETEVERLRFDNEELGAAGETLRVKVEDLMTQSEEEQNKYQSVISSLGQEKELLKESLKLKNKEVHDLQLELDKMEARLTTNIRKVRFRERELENRLEIVKMENIALIRSKDEIILDVKRQIDQLNQDLERFKTKSFQVNKNMKEKNDVMRRTVKALRLALSLLEGHDESISLKKVD